MNKTTGIRWISRLTIVSLILSGAAVVKAQEEPKKEKPKAAVQSEPVSAFDEQRIANETKALKTLSGTTWKVITTLQETKRHEQGIETFTFTGRRLMTQNLAAMGYSPDGSNYSIYVETDGTIVWESMLRSADGGQALLRGDLRGNVMTGAIDIQPKKGVRKIYYFTSKK